MIKMIRNTFGLPEQSIKQFRTLQYEFYSRVGMELLLSDCEALSQFEIAYLHKYHSTKLNPQQTELLRTYRYVEWIDEVYNNTVKEHNKLEHIIDDLLNVKIDCDYKPLKRTDMLRRIKTIYEGNK